MSRQDSRTFSHHGDTMGELVRALSLDSSQPGFQGQLYHDLEFMVSLSVLGFFAYTLRTVLFESQPCYED